MLTASDPVLSTKLILLYSLCNNLLDPMNGQQAELLDGSIQAFGGKDYRYDLADHVKYTPPEERQIENPLAMDQLPGRRLIDAKSVSLFTDRYLNYKGVLNIPEIALAMEQRRFEDLPDVLKPGRPMPANMSMQVIIEPLGDDTWNSFKYFIVKEVALTGRAAQNCCCGKAMAPSFQTRYLGLKERVA